MLPKTYPGWKKCWCRLTLGKQENKNKKHAGVDLPGEKQTWCGHTPGKKTCRCGHTQGKRHTGVDILQVKKHAGVDMPQVKNMPVWTYSG